MIVFQTLPLNNPTHATARQQRRVRRDGVAPLRHAISSNHRLDSLKGQGIAFHLHAPAVVMMQIYAVSGGQHPEIFICKFGGYQ